MSKQFYYSLYKTPKLRGFPPQFCVHIMSLTFQFHSTQSQTPLLYFSKTSAINIGEFYQL